jgi:7-cyano-7-deazaguanine synthase
LKTARTSLYCRNDRDATSAHTASSPPFIRENRQAAAVTDLVLCSGGMDSATLAAQLCGTGQTPELYFVDYGQPAAAAERQSVHAIAVRLSLTVMVAHVGGLDVPEQGEITGRNMMLVTLALAAHPHVRSIGIGIHAGTGYRDCSSDFVDLAQQVLDFHRDGGCRLVAPFVDWSKADVVALAVQLDLPIGMTYSCETGDRPCGSCRSCRDREALHAG